MMKSVLHMLRVTELFFLLVLTLRNLLSGFVLKPFRGFCFTLLNSCTLPSTCLMMMQNKVQSPGCHPFFPFPIFCHEACRSHDSPSLVKDRILVSFSPLMLFLIRLIYGMDMLKISNYPHPSRKILFNSACQKGAAMDH